MMMPLSSWLAIVAACCWGAAVLATPPWPHPYWDIPGDYCKAKYPSGQCCFGRQDPCNVPILGMQYVLTPFATICHQQALSVIATLFAIARKTRIAARITLRTARDCKEPARTSWPTPWPGRKRRSPARHLRLRLLVALREACWPLWKVRTHTT